MIINTVILFLRDLLPLFILLSYLQVFLKNKTLGFSYLSSAISFGVLSSLLFFLAAPYVSEIFEGTGIERTFVALLFITYCFLFFINASTSKNSLLSSHTKNMILFGVGAFIVLKASAFLIFFDVYFQRQNNHMNILIGCIIGLGICASFSTLFSFILTEIIERNRNRLINVFWALFLAGQISQITTYLSQVDLINVGPPIVNLSAFVQDNSEYGHVLKALIGYEESPSLLFLVIYGLAFTLPFITQSITKAFIEKNHYDK